MPKKPSKPPSTALHSVMAPKRELFDGLTEAERQTWSQTRLAAYCGVSHQTMNNWNGRGKQTPAS